MSALAAITLQNPIVPIVCPFDYDDAPTLKVEHTYRDATTQRDVTKKLFLPYVGEPQQKELMLYVVHEFVASMGPEGLNLANATDRYHKFCLVVTGALRISWDTLATARATKTANFLRKTWLLSSRFISRRLLSKIRRNICAL